jgi:CBS domain-containing protein
MNLTKLFGQPSVQDIMTRMPKTCTRETPIKEATRLMVVCNCGGIPVVESEVNQRLVGFITDRDIVCRGIAEGHNPLEQVVGDCMSSPCYFISQDATVGECCALMEDKQIRRLPVVDRDGKCCGILCQADIARNTNEQRTGTLVKEVSEPAATHRAVA